MCSLHYDKFHINHNTSCRHYLMFRIILKNRQRIADSSGEERVGG